MPQTSAESSWAAMRAFLGDVVFVGRRDDADSDDAFPWAAFARRTEHVDALVSMFREAIRLGEVDLDVDEFDAAPSAVAVRTAVCAVINELFAGDVEDVTLAFDELDDCLRQVAEEDEVRRRVMESVECSSRELFRRILGDPQASG